LKILRLDLIATGPFTGTSLNFENHGNPIHIIYGQNEAGKSSCLRAIRYWLFGFPHQTIDNFLHSYGNLRIGGELEDEQGNRLEMIRRKANSGGLRAANDVDIIDTDRVYQFIGELDGSTFERRFGIDHQELVKGGHELVSGGGELGEILFSAGSGITALPKIQDDLEREMRTLFAAKRPSATINSATSKLIDTRAQIRNLSLSGDQWQQRQQALEKAISQHEEIELQLSKFRCELNRLNRIQKGIPLFIQLNTEKQKCEELKAVRILPDDFTERRTLAANQKIVSDRMRQEAELEIQKLRKLITDVNLPSHVLEYQSAIQSLHTELGSYLKATKDRPRLIAEVRIKEDSLKSLFKDLGWEENLLYHQQLQLNQLQRVRLRELSNRYDKLEAQRNELQKIDRRLSQSIRDCKSKINEGRIDLDPTLLKQAIQRTLSLGNIETQRDQAKDDLFLLLERANAELNLLPLVSWKLDDLPTLSLPLMESIEKFNQDFQDIDNRLSRCSDKTKELMANSQQVKRSLRQLMLESDVPTEDDLRQARDQRDRGWSIVVSVWHGEISEDHLDVTNYCGELGIEEDLVSAFQSSINLVDTIADRLRREATRVAEKIKLTAEAEDLDHRIENEKLENERVKAAREDLVQQWKRLWQSVGLEPLTPHEMVAWRRKIEELRAQAVSIRLTKQRINDLEKSVANAREDLRTGLSRNDTSVPGPLDSLGQWLEQSQKLLDSLENTQQLYRDRTRQLEKLEDEYRQNSDELAGIRLRIELWNKEWLEAIAVLKLPGIPKCSEVQLLLQTLDHLQATHQSIEELKRRVEGIDREATQFSQSVGQTAAQVAPELDLPVDQLVIELNRRLDVAYQTQTRLDQWHERIFNEQSKLDNATSEYKRWSEELRLLCEYAGCSCADDLPLAEERSRERHQCDLQIKKLENELNQLAAPDSVPNFIATLEVSNGDSIAAEIQHVEATIDRLEKELGDASQAIGSEQTKLAQLDGSALASQMQEDAEELLASIRSDTEQYIRLWLSWKILKDSIERFRQHSQGPILTRAGELFKRLTLGSFSKLQADYDERGRAILVGIRSGNNSSVGVDGMSEGTRDQLYLALRLALLEEHLENHTPMPLIVDDILIQFDDARSEAAIEILSEFADRTQVIFFTHHHRLVELAEKTLPPSKYAIHRL
jgi:uncharacterized protein YhaN